MAKKSTRRCKQKTKTGKPCRASPRHGAEVCMAHTDVETQESMGFGPEAGRRFGGRPRRARPTEVLRERIERELDRWLKPLEDALTAERGVVVGDGSHARLEFVPDWPVRLKAVAQAFDRAYGRPPQAHEIRHLTESSQIDAEIERLLKEMAEREKVDATVPAN